MKRRSLLSGVAAAIAWPGDSVSQISRKPVIGCLFYNNPEPILTLIRAALARLGYRAEQTIDLDVRLANGSDTQVTQLAVDLVARKVDIILAFTTPAAKAAQAATSVIPIVAIVADPLGSDLSKSLTRPTGNITGYSLAVKHVSGKLLGLLLEATPSARRIGLLVNTADPFSKQLIEGVEEANLGMKVDLRIFQASKEIELEGAFAQMAAEKIDAAIIQPTLTRASVVSLTIRHKLPTGQPLAGYASAGGLLEYAAKLSEVVAVVAAQLDQILKGVKLADIPIRQPTKFEMGLNLKTANALGLTIPPMLLAQADEIIE